MIRRVLVWVADMAGAAGDALFHAGAYEPLHDGRKASHFEETCTWLSERCDAFADWIYDLADGGAL